MGELVLRPLRAEDRVEAEAAHAEFAAEGFPFLLERELADTFDDYLGLLARREVGDMPDDWVPAVFLVAEVDGGIVGRASVRFGLNDFLRREGGHVGYGVRPGFRRQGHATAILRASLAILADHGIAPALVTCDDDNAASARTIEHCGGILDDVVEVDRLVRRYWVATT